MNASGLFLEVLMIKPIVRDILFLGQKSEEATKQDLPIGHDLQDTGG